MVDYTYTFMNFLKVIKAIGLEKAKNMTKIN